MVGFSSSTSSLMRGDSALVVAAGEPAFTVMDGERTASDGEDPPSIFIAGDALPLLEPLGFILSAKDFFQAATFASLANLSSSAALAASSSAVGGRGVCSISQDLESGTR